MNVIADKGRKKLMESNKPWTYLSYGYYYY